MISHISYVNTYHDSCGILAGCHRALVCWDRSSIGTRQASGWSFFTESLTNDSSGGTIPTENLADLLPECVFDYLNYLSSAELLSYENGLTVRGLRKEGTKEDKTLQSLDIAFHQMTTNSISRSPSRKSSSNQIFSSTASGTDINRSVKFRNLIFKH